ncbi:MAG TPA: FAD-dependent oxidoreductase, partial [Salinimicrobium sp.]|nr:FAD-dependent oxidoreductase [Salinimicrobium sp.]
WLAIKSHYKAEDFPAELVALHNFKGGYCGLSRTETSAVNVCYLATYKSFKRCKDPGSFLEQVLRKNPFLDKFFADAVPVFKKPLTIAQVSFEDKKIIEDHIIMIGDAAGLLHPLCGNGMAIAIHSGKIASETISKHLDRPVFKRVAVESDYSNNWNRIFRRRFRTGKWLQNILLHEKLAEASQGIISKVPFLLPAIIRQTHGKSI